MSQASTSFHRLNADRGLSFSEKLRYLAYNTLNNSLPYFRLDSHLRIRDFRCNELKKQWGQLEPLSSPARKWSDLFWLNFPWNKVKKELGGIRIFDSGCGTGKYGVRLTDWSQDLIERYLGTDLYKNEVWQDYEKKYKNFRFKVLNSKDISSHIPKDTNFFMTQSAIEHFDEDLTYFRYIKDYIRSYDGSVLQVHIFPAGACLPLYLFHGVRQYTPRTVSKISRLFNDFSDITLFRLGGKKSKHLHFNFVTKSTFFLRKGDLRKKQPERYDDLLFKAMSADMRSPQPDYLFNALVIHSNPKQTIFG